MQTATSPRAKNALLIIGGLVSGFINGLLGAGGGIVIVFILGHILSSDRTDKSGFERKDIFANALAAMLPVSAVSVISYAARGAISFEGTEIFILPAIIGGLCGAFLLDRVQSKTATRIFALIIIYSGLSMLIR